MALTYRDVPDGGEMAIRSTCGETFNDLTRIVEGLKQSLADGDLNSYDTLVNCFAAETSASGADVNQLRSEIQGKRVGIDKLEHEWATYSTTQVSLNLLGLVLVLLKDIPIWREASGRRATTR